MACSKAEIGKRGDQMHETVARGTLRVTCGQSTGSGFIYRHAQYVLTNCHVVQPYHGQGNPIVVVSENGHSIPATLVSSSPANAADFAILKLQQAFPSGYEILQPEQTPTYERGREVIFSGFPHGIPNLLTHQAVISGSAPSNGFFLDGSVNGGNSGGPIVDRQSGHVIGIVTQRRFLGGAELQALHTEMQQLEDYCRGIAQRGKITLMGIDFGAFAGSVARGFQLSRELFNANANTGIGIGFRIEFAESEWTRLALS
jgi:hypothetical protein